jgi:hypothetical protein
MVLVLANRKLNKKHAMNAKNPLLIFVPVIAGLVFSQVTGNRDFPAGYKYF